jgi:hypothetical protein
MTDATSAMRIGAVAAVVGTLVALVAPTATGGSAATMTVDRTLLCSTLADASGERAVGLGVAPASAYSKALLGVFVFGKTGGYDWPPLVHVVAPGPGDPPVHGLWINTSRCRSVGHRFLLSRAGLPAAVTQIFTEERCAAGRTVLVRVRVTLARWRGWRRGPARFWGTLEGRGRPIAASVAVRTQGGPVAYAMLDRGGRTRLVTAGEPRCRIS